MGRRHGHQTATILINTPQANKKARQDEENNVRGNIQKWGKQVENHI